MKKYIVQFAVSIAIAAMSFSAIAQSKDSSQKSDDVSAEVSKPEKVDKSSTPLREMVDNALPKVARGGRDFEPGKPLPIGNTNPKVIDPLAVQGVGSTIAVIEPKASTNGVPVDPNARVAPPDTTGDLGPNHYVQWVNSRYSVYSVTRDANNQINGFNIVPGFPKNGNTVWQGFGGRCESDNDGDPLVQYDQIADRWILTQFAVSASPYHQCVAVSTTPDPTGTYYRYDYSFGTDFNDFPKMGIWGDTYVITYNIFRRGSRFTGNRVCGYERNQMLVGGVARQVCANTSSSNASLLPADVEGNYSPTPGTANPLLSISTTALLSWRFTVNWNAGTGTLSGPTTVAGVAAFSRACSGGTCIPQPGTTNRLDSLADRLNYRLSYRNFGTYETLLVNHAVSANGGSGIRWYELRNASGQTVSSATPVVFQQGTYAPDSNYRWMGSAAMDKNGGIAVGYNISNATSINPSIRYAFRSAADPLGSLGGEVGLFTGPGSQTGTLTRWGDYSMLSLDPVDGCTMVFTTEYIPSNGSFNWSTYIGSFKLSTCN